MKPAYTYLALGDSYTIGELVPLQQSFPYQCVQLLREKGLPFLAPEILAKTGWTTGELEEAIRNYRFLSRYDTVSLLIGVNNQYRGLSIEEYRKEFESLLQKAINFAGGEKENVTVLSIPDYSVMPAVAQMDPARISAEIDRFNRVNRKISLGYGTGWLDITKGSREAKHDPELVVSDGLHPSGKEYAKWASALASGLSAQFL
jgi:lysophospholipase L1-like esterase